MQLNINSRKWSLPHSHCSRFSLLATFFSSSFDRSLSDVAVAGLSRDPHLSAVFSGLWPIYSERPLKGVFSFSAQIQRSRCFLVNSRRCRSAKRPRLISRPHTSRLPAIEMGDARFDFFDPVTRKTVCMIFNPHNKHNSVSATFPRLVVIYRLYLKFWDISLKIPHITLLTLTDNCNVYLQELTYWLEDLCVVQWTRG